MPTDVVRKSTANDTTNHYVTKNATEHKSATFLINRKPALPLSQSYVRSGTAWCNSHSRDWPVSSSTMLWLDTKVTRKKVRYEARHLRTATATTKRTGCFRLRRLMRQEGHDGNNCSQIRILLAPHRWGKATSSTALRAVQLLRKIITNICNQIYSCFLCYAVCILTVSAYALLTF